MQNKRTIMYFFSAIFLVGALLLCVFYFGHGSVMPLWVTVHANGQEERIACWEKEEGQYYIFLPGYTGLANAKIALGTNTVVTLNGTVLYDGMRCDGFSLDVPYVLEYSVLGERKKADITFVQSGGVATMYIDTESRSMDHIHTKKGNEEPGTLRLYSATGDLEYTGSLESINGRGNSTWTDAEKKSYSVTLTENGDLLGMGSAYKWVLLSNALDPSNLRNKIVYDFAKDIGMSFAPDCEWVDLYLNGEYAGLYLLCERNEVHPERVDIAQEQSFLMSLELEDRLVSQNLPHITTSTRQALRIHYPLDVSTELRDALTEKWESIERAILAEDNMDAVTGKTLTELIDIESWVKRYLIDEVFGNFDGGVVSQYFYYDGNDELKRVYAGPVWDYDLSMGLDYTWQLENPESFFAYRLKIKDGRESPWMYELYNKDAVYSSIVEVYQKEILPRIEQLFETEIHVLAQKISAAAKMNQERWNLAIDAVQCAEEMCCYMSDRIAFLTSIWIEDINCCRVTFKQGFNTNYAHYVVPVGKGLKEMPSVTDTETAAFLGWYYSDTNEPFDPTRPITEDIEIYAKWEDSASNTRDDIMKLAPLGVIAALGLVLLVVEIKRIRKRR